MSTPNPSRPLADVPSWDELRADPSLFDALRAEVQATVYTEIATMEARLRAKLLSRPSIENVVPDAEGTDRLLSVPKTAALLDFKPAYVYELIRRGLLPAVSVESMFVFRCRGSSLS